MGWLHTWTGLLVGWVLFFMFLTGTAGYFDTEIDSWMQPERPIVQNAMTATAAVDAGRQYLESNAPNAARWFIAVPSHRFPELRLFWRMSPDADGKRGRTGRARLDPETAAPLNYRDTGGGQLLYSMHWRLHYMPVRAAEWIVGVCTMFMLIAIVTGVIIHKRIFRDFFTLRFAKGQRSWLDAHNVLSVLALPFHLMITYSGLIFIAYVYMTPVITASYGTAADAQDSFFNELLRRTDGASPSGVAADLMPLRPMVLEAERQWGEGRVRFVEIRHPGDRDASVRIGHEWASPVRRPPTLTFNGANGELLRASDGIYSTPLAVRDVLLGLHEGLFAGPVLRWLYFLSGVMGTAMIGAGMILWTVKRRAKKGDAFGFKLVERLNVGTLAGLPVAVAAYFWANRLIPVDVAGRVAWEGHTMFIVWGVMLAHAFIRPSARAWVEQLWLAAAAFGLIPVLNGLTTDKHLGVTLPAGVWELAGVDLTMFAFGAAFAFAAIVLGRRGKTLKSGACHPGESRGPGPQARSRLDATAHGALDSGIRRNDGPIEGREVVRPNDRP